jgi:hypothetical protein
MPSSSHYSDKEASMKSLSVVIQCILCLGASAATAQVRNPGFDTDLNYWLTAYENITSGVLTPGTVTWDPAYGGSAMMVVNGAPGNIGICAPTHSTISAGQTVAVDVAITDLGNFAGVHLVIGDWPPDGNGQQADLQAGPGDYTLSILANKTYPQGTFFAFWMTAWPGACTCWVKDVRLLGIEDEPGSKPPVLSILDVRPTPATARVTAALTLPQACRASVAVYDATGVLVKKLQERHFTAGRHTVSWNRRDEDGHMVSPGTYFVRLSTEDGREEAVEVAIVR